MTEIHEINFDGLVGPTHNFAGLSFGNIASHAHSKQTSHPKKAALQGLEKMATLMRMGLKQGVFPPHERPHIPSLRKLGFQGTASDIIKTAAADHKQLLTNMSSASSMWVANAGTTSASSDTSDGKTHFTAANLSSMLHRSIEHEHTSKMLRTIFASDQFFAHHDALPGTQFFGDEGAANHTRFCNSKGTQGLSCFVYGQSYMQGGIKPAKYPARQTLEASEAIARQHGLTAHNTLFLQQNPDVIDQGVFHNDVIAVGSRNIMFCHEQAFLNQKAVLTALQQEREKTTGEAFHIIEVPTAAVSVQDAVSTYLFNTQLVFPQGKKATIIAPQECHDNPAVKDYLESLTVNSEAIEDVKFFDLRQSMNNGGGPACLRFRAALSNAEIESIGISTNTLMTEKLYEQLTAWVSKHYRDELTPDDLLDPALYQESMTALDELTSILKVGSHFYDFQK